MTDPTEAIRKALEAGLHLPISRRTRHRHRPSHESEGMTHKTVPVEPTPGLKRHALEAAQRLSRYAAAPFFPDVEKRGIVRQTSAEWWDGLANEIEEAQPLIHRALMEMAAPPSPVTELERELSAALWHIKNTAVSLADAQVIALEALAAFNAKKGAA